jgi:hypothetical protein
LMLSHAVRGLHSTCRGGSIGVMLSRADDLAKLTVLDETGKTVELGSLWRDQTIVLMFIRHFG